MDALRGWGLWLAGLLTVCLLAAAVARGQTGSAAPAEQRPLMSEQAFKDVRLLRGIPVREFMETMGFFSAALALNCTDCHGEASASWADYATETTRKQTTRRMIQMVNAINRTNFGGAPAVTCETCHRGSPRPKVIPSLERQYGVPPDEDPDEIEPHPAVRSTMTAEQILDRYIQAIGGAASAAKLTSYTAKGTYEGFDSDFEEVPVDIYARAPGLRTTVVHMRAGDNTTTVDGREAWAAGPSDLTPVTLISLVGASLDGARLDAQLAFPGQIKQILTDWRTGFPPLRIDDRPVDVIEGRTPEKRGVKLYFDRETGFLVRSVRHSTTAVGTVPIKVIYSNYRDVPGLGVKIPYTWEVTWTNGRGTYNITSLQPNAAIDAARFGRPTPPGQPRN
jgi:photosynthetic reaction center cytochrome c subunit